MQRCKHKIGRRPLMSSMRRMMGHLHSNWEIEVPRSAGACRRQLGREAEWGSFLDVGDCCPLSRLSFVVRISTMAARLTGRIPGLFQLAASLKACQRCTITLQVVNRSDFLDLQFEHVIHWINSFSFSINISFRMYSSHKRSHWSALFHRVFAGSVGGMLDGCVYYRIVALISVIASYVV